MKTFAYWVAGLATFSSMSCSSIDSENEGPDGLAPQTAGAGQASADPSGGGDQLDPSTGSGGISGGSEGSVERPGTPGVPSTDVVTTITASRMSCVSPCPVVFSAEATAAPEMDSHEVWRELAFHWDFNTTEADTYGGLYPSSYTYVPGDPAREVGHVPLVTKTFFCETGTCEYEVGLRAQTSDGEYGDSFITIAVTSEEDAWNAKDTVCVSQGLSTSSDWTAFDKPCPGGAEKSNTLPDADEFGGRLILLHRGDVWDQNLATMMSEDDFKLGYFGDAGESKPEFTGTYFHGASQINAGPMNAPTAVWSFANDDHVSAQGWPENNTIEGIAFGAVTLGMSYQHVTLHDVDLDREAEETGGYITLVRGHLYCYDFPGELACDNVPFPKGAYLSGLRVVGGSGTGAIPDATLNVGSIGCGMVNWTGIVDSYFRKAYEHNLRVMGWYRFSIMRNLWAGEHYKSSKQKLSTRPCAGGPDWQNWSTWKPDGFSLDPEGRTRADSARGDGTDAFNTGHYAHESRYQATIGNVIGVAGVEGALPGGPKYQTNIAAGSGHEALVADVMVSENTFVDEGSTHTSDINAPGQWVTCINNTYSDGTVSCGPSSADEWNMSIEPEGAGYPLAPEN